MSRKFRPKKKPMVLWVVANEYGDVWCYRNKKIASKAARFQSATVSKYVPAEKA